MCLFTRGMIFFILFLPFLVSAHHSVALNFTQEVVAIEGKIKDIKWINPHASFILETRNQSGEVEEWLIELLAVIALRRSGFNFDALRSFLAVEPVTNEEIMRLEKERDNQEKMEYLSDTEIIDSNKSEDSQSTTENDSQSNKNKIISKNKMQKEKIKRRSLEKKKRLQRKKQRK